MLAELTRDHHIVAETLRAIEDLLGGLTAEPGPDEARRVRAELDGLAAVLESHFVYEEKRLVAVLNSLSPAPGP